MSAKNNRKFANFILNPQAQLKITMFYLGAAILYAAANAYLVQRTLNAFKQGNHQLLSDETTNSLFFDLTLAGGAYLTLVLIISFIVQHRVTGPAYAINRSLRSILNNAPYIPLSLRKHDILKETADLVNELGQATPQKDVFD